MDLVVQLLESITKTLCSYTRLQSLAMAVLGLEREWPVFLEWTKNKEIPYLLRSPEEYREPFRHALDLLWEQVKNEQLYNEHQEVFDSLHLFVESSYHEDDAVDVDFGNARSFIEALISSGIGAFFPIKPERRFTSPWNEPDFYEKRAASLALTYTEDLYNFLFEKVLDEFPTERFGTPKANEMIARNPLWIAEIERLQSDLLLIRNFPANKDIVEKQMITYRELSIVPLPATS